jgi:1-acyl-sn-glycerol-3-phosphate acyltransferase
MGRFKNGPFKLAIEKQIPIILITYLTNWKLLPEHSNGIGHPGVSKIIVHEPVETKGMTEENMEELKEKVYAIIEAPLKQKFSEYFQSSVKQQPPAVSLQTASAI